MKPKAFSIATNSTFTTLIVVLMLTGSALAAGSRFAVIHRFDGGDGFAPVFALAADQAGNLYGLTYGNDAFPPRVFELSPPAVPGGPWVETTLYTFHDIINGGAPTSSLIFDQAGNLYGTARDGAFGSGVVYQLSPPTQPGGAWTESVLYSFQSEGSGDGALPFGGVVQDSVGNLYGGTFIGGAFNMGTVFQLAPPAEQGGAWTETVLHSFNGIDGVNPFGRLLMGNGGALFGTTSPNASCCGTVFKLNPPAIPGGSWTNQVLYEFSGGSDGSLPTGGLVSDKMNNLYGTTALGGNSGQGTIFELTPPSAPGGAWTETVLYSFSGGFGALPSDTPPIFDKKGNLYGTTFYGGPWEAGTVYRLSPPPVPGGAWTETVLHTFHYLLYGYLPDGPTFGPGGSLYGNTESGGSYGGFGSGTVFRIEP